MARKSTPLGELGANPPPYKPAVGPAGASSPADDERDPGGEQHEADAPGEGQALLGDAEQAELVDDRGHGELAREQAGDHRAGAEGPDGDRGDADDGGAEQAAGHVVPPHGVRADPTETAAERERDHEQHDRAGREGDGGGRDGTDVATERRVDRRLHGEARADGEREGDGAPAIHSPPRYKPGRTMRARRTGPHPSLPSAVAVRLWRSGAP